MAFRSEPNLSFHRSKQSVAVRLSVTVVTREELKHSDMRGQFVEYLSTRDLRRESSLELHSFSDFLRKSLSLTEAECSWKAKLDAEVLVLPSKSSERNQCSFGVTEQTSNKLTARAIFHNPHTIVNFSWKDRRLFHWQPPSLLPSFGRLKRTDESRLVVHEPPGRI